LKQQTYHHVVEKDILHRSPESEAYILENIIKAEVFGQLTKAIKTLPPLTQKILELIYFEGKKIREVAAQLDVAQVTVKKKKANALLELKKQISFLLWFV
jgi:RNA polymerase sigma factor (sigma-70 family)